MSKVEYYRKLLHLTQNELAEKSGISLRTIQRMESGSIPKGFTLKALAKALEVEPNELLENKNLESSKEKQDFSNLKLLNTSILAFFIIPYGNLIFPTIIYCKNKQKDFRNVGSRIIDFQILWTIITSSLLIASPFIQKILELKTPFILWSLIFCILINLIVTFLNAISLSENNTLKISSPIRFL